MYFDSFAALMNMDGHGAYVWFCYGLSLLVLVGLVAAPLRRQRIIRRMIAAAARREAAELGN